MGCLVTDQIVFPLEPNYPPSIESRDEASGLNPPTPVDQVVDVDLDTMTGEIFFPVSVRDPNTSQTLLYAAFLDCPGTTVTVARQRLAPSASASGGAAVARDLDLRVPVSSLVPFAGGCCRLELLVSSEFDFVSERQPVLPGDLGSAVWWLAMTDAAHRSVDMTLCP